jgi:hypothetical protein
VCLIAAHNCGGSARYLLLLETPKKVEAGGRGGLRSRAPDHYVRGALHEKGIYYFILIIKDKKNRGPGEDVILATND